MATLKPQETPTSAAPPPVYVDVPSLHPGQAIIDAEKRRFNVLALGRRFGKTFAGIHWLLLPALGVGTADGRGLPVAWFAPNYRLLTEVWTDVKRRLAPVTTRISAQERRIEILGGGVVEFWSLDGEVVVRGRKYARVIVDEAAFVQNLEQAWQKAIRPTLADYAGDAFFLSTPQGLNYFHTLFQLGLDPENEEWASWQQPTHRNPFILPSEIEAMRLGMPEKTYSQEILAEFQSDGTSVFRNVKECATATPQGPEEGRRYAIGCDWGRSNDFTVFCVMDIKDRRMVHIERSNKIEYAMQRGRLIALCDHYKPAAIVAEENSIGQPIIEQLRRENLYITPFMTTNASKMKIIDNLALHFERKAISILDESWLINELIAFDQTRLPSGAVRYAAPEGLHDDCLPPGTLIRTRRGVVPVQDVRVGDSVLTHRGRYRTVTALGQRQASELYEVEATGRPTLRLTGNHRLLVRRRGMDYASGANTLTHGVAEWLCVDDGIDLGTYGSSSVAPSAINEVHTVDLLTYCPSTYQDREGYLVATTYGGTRINPKCNRVPRHVPVDTDFCRMLGYYAAEGSVGRHNVGWASHTREGAIRDWLSEYLRRLGLKPTLCQTSPEGWTVSAGSVPFRGFFAQEMGKRTEKHLPVWVETLPLDLQWEVLTGWILGDGHFGAGGVNGVTISPTLAAQLHEIAIRLRLPCSLKTAPGQNGHNPQWVLQFGVPTTRIIQEKIGAHLLDAKLRHDREYKCDQTQLRFADEHLVGKIKKIVAVPYEGTVYNLEVDEDHSYVANGTIVHNCVMATALALEACGGVDGFVEYLKSRVKHIEAEKDLRMVAGAAPFISYPEGTNDGTPLPV